MKQNYTITSGHIDARGGLKLDLGEFSEFLKKWPNSKCIIRVDVCTPGTSASAKAYYFKYIVPTITKAFWSIGQRNTDEETENFLREISPICEQCTPNENGKYTCRVKEFAELSGNDLHDHIEFIKQWAAENLSVYVEDPKDL